MYSITGDEDNWVLIRSIALIGKETPAVRSIRVSLRAPTCPFTQYSQYGLLLAMTHASPAGDFLYCTPTANTVALRVHDTDFDAGRLQLGSGHIVELLGLVPYSSSPFAKIDPHGGVT
jgi:hypothetical protein